MNETLALKPAEAYPQPTLVDVEAYKAAPPSLIDLLPPAPEALGPIEASKWQSVGRSALTRAAVEVVGIGVDVALMGAGRAGVGLLEGVVAREVTATVPEVAALEKFLGHGHENHGESSKMRKAARKAGNLALGVTTAIVAQKAGVHAIEHISSGLNHGIGEFAVPITSKVSALASLSAFRGRRRPGRV